MIACIFSLSAGLCSAQGAATADSAVPAAPVAPATPAPCARNPDVASVKRILQSSDEREAKAQKLAVAAENSIVKGWSTISRPDDVSGVVTEIAEIQLTRFGSPIPKDKLDENAKILSDAIGNALNAICGMADQDLAKLKAAAFTAAALNVEEEVKAVADSTPVKIKSSGDAYGPGDRLRFYTETDGFRLVKESVPTTLAVAPCGSKFRITQVDDAGENVLGYFYEVPKIGQTVSVGNKIARWFRRDECSEYKAIANAVEKSKDYQISAERLARTPAYTSGFEFGVLVAPYKFHFSDDSTTPSATVGGYFGFRYGNPAVSVSPVFSVGLGAVTETDPEIPEGGTEPAKPGTLACLSAAAGVLFKIRKAGGFTVGLLLGSDWTGDKDRYRYDGRLWAAISVGLPITE